MHSTMTAVVRTRAWVDVDVVVGRGRGREVRTRASPPGTSAFESESARVVVATSRAMDHACEGHPESNARVPAIEEALKRHGLTPETRQGEVVEIVGFASATNSALEGVREEAEADGLGAQRRFSRADELDGAPTYCTESSYRDVMYGVGAATALVDEVIARGAGKTRRWVRVDSTARDITSMVREVRWGSVWLVRPRRRRDTRKRRGFKRFSSLITTCITETGRMTSFTTIPACSCVEDRRAAVIRAPAK